jgi:hypothetical protein
MDVDSLIDVQWFGLRRAGGKNRVWGFFTPKGVFNEQNPLAVRYRNQYHYVDPRPDPRVCVFWGNVGKELRIQEVDYTYEFQGELATKRNNFKEYDYHRILPNWRQFREEMELYVLMRKLKGEQI